MTRADFIIPECFIDTNLVETLVFGQGMCNHQKGCNQVTRIMQTKFADRFAVGIIDADKRMPGYTTEFNVVATSSHLSLLRHKIKPHFIVKISPACDGFILDCAARSGVNPEKFNLPTQPKPFTTQTKNVLSSRDARFKSLFNSLAEDPEMDLMKSLLSYLAERSYSASDVDITNLFNKLI